MLLFSITEYKRWYVNSTVATPPEAYYDELEIIKYHSRQSNYDKMNRWDSNNERINPFNSTEANYTEPKYDLGNYNCF